MGRGSGGESGGREKEGMKRERGADRASARTERLISHYFSDPGTMPRMAEQWEASLISNKILEIV